MQSAESLRFTCPSCGRPTGLTDYGPEPTLCLECQRAFGLAERLAEHPSPDNPVWGIPESVALWIAAFCALLVSEMGAALYLVYAGIYDLPIPADQEITTDPSLLVARILSLGVGHAITFLLAWLIVTDAGRLRFFESVGWGWRRGVGPRQVVLVFLAIYALSLVVSNLLPEQGPTPFSRVLDSSFAVRIAVGIFAVVSAPLVEEVIYRGVMYPAFARRFGQAAAILLVSALFLVVHADQYAAAPAIMIPLGALSLALTWLRAYTGSLLPSFALHLLFNTVNVVLILVGVGRST